MPEFSLLFPHKAAEHFPLSHAYSVTGKCDCRSVGTPQPPFLQQTMAKAARIYQLRPYRLIRNSKLLSTDVQIKTKADANASTPAIASSLAEG